LFVAMPRRAIESGRRAPASLVRGRCRPESRGLATDFQQPDPDESRISLSSA
jgi:hypothetical protein